MLTILGAADDRVSLSQGWTDLGNGLYEGQIGSDDAASVIRLKIETAQVDTYVAPEPMMMDFAPMSLGLESLEGLEAEDQAAAPQDLEGLFQAPAQEDLNDLLPASEEGPAAPRPIAQGPDLSLASRLLEDELAQALEMEH